MEIEPSSVLTMATIASSGEISHAEAWLERGRMFFGGGGCSATHAQLALQVKPTSQPLLGPEPAHEGASGWQPRAWHVQLVSQS
jgi:hypothetical protein